MKTCIECKEDHHEEDFWVKQTKSNGEVRRCNICRHCEGSRDKKRTRSRKDRAVKYYGGACGHCGGVFQRSVYDFHHTDESTKEHDPSELISSTEDFEIVKKELDKCLLLCANCHRMEHARLDGTL